MSIQQYEAQSTNALATTQDVAVHRLGEWAHSAQAAHQVATTLVQTSFCPDAFRNKPGEATAAILAGMEVGLQPMAALRSFDVIQGQAAARAITLRAIVQSQGHEMELVESTGTRCRMRGRRRGAAEWQSVTWTMDRARDLNLTNKPNWKNQPQTMLVARATSELARLIASDAILGLPYSAEEIADGGTYEQQVATATTTPTGAPATRRMSRNQNSGPAEAPTGDTIDVPSDVDAVVEPQGTAGPESPAVPMVSKAQLSKIGACMNDLDIKERAEALGYVSATVGRPIESRSDLTREEAKTLIDRLESDIAAAGVEEAEVIA